MRTYSPNQQNIDFLVAKKLKNSAKSLSIVKSDLKTGSALLLLELSGKLAA
jgi:hypothetical protein